MTNFAVYFYKFLEIINLIYGVKIKYKDSSKFMKFLSYLLFFNKSFMTNYTTTIGNTVYFPTQSKIDEAVNNSSLATLCHESQHIYDSKSYKAIWYYIAYLFPQILAPFMLFFAFISWYLALGLFILFLLPLPAPFRMIYERRGYIINMLIINQIQKEYGVNEGIRKSILLPYIEDVNDQFTSSAYYFMWPFGIKGYLLDRLDDIVSGKILEKYPSYDIILKSFICAKV